MRFIWAQATVRASERETIWMIGLQSDVLRLPWKSRFRHDTSFYKKMSLTYRPHAAPKFLFPPCLILEL